MGVDLEEIARIVARMRELGVAHLRSGDLELTLTEPTTAGLADAPVPTEAQRSQWPESNGDVYLDEHTYSRGVPTLRRFYEPGDK